MWSCGHVCAFLICCETCNALNNYQARLMAAS
uniref:Uncharacterized protein n=1 Tax=Triticum urartu TaxID=4572 RepID=A0A8R7P2Q0_TRIUA